MKPSSVVHRVGEYNRVCWPLCRSISLYRITRYACTYTENESDNEFGGIHVTYVDAPVDCIFCLVAESRIG